MNFGDKDRIIKMICNGLLGITIVGAYCLLPHNFLELFVLAVLLWQDQKGENMGYYNCLMLLLSSADCGQFVATLPRKHRRVFWAMYWALTTGFKMLGVINLCASL